MAENSEVWPIKLSAYGQVFKQLLEALLGPNGIHDTLQEQTVHLLFIFFIFESTIMAILTRKLFPDFVVGTTGQGVSPGTTNITPQQSCKLAIGHRPQESS